MKTASSRELLEVQPGVVGGTPSATLRRKTTPVKPRSRLRVRRILTTTDFSDESLAGVRYAAALGRPLEASVDLLHVIEPAPRFGGLEAVTIGRNDKEIEARARARTERYADMEGTGEFRMVACTQTGKPYREISAAARRATADLIVIATHGYTGARRVLLGSTAERVVRHARCPVLAVPADFECKPELALKKILVPIDFSSISRDALPWAIFLAERFGGKIVLVHIVEKFPIDYLVGNAVTALEPFIRRAQSDLQKLAKNVSATSGVDVSALVLVGTPFEKICEAANTLGADIVVLTTHGRTGLKHAWIGSTAERVVRIAQRPVLAVRKREGRRD